MYPKSLLDPQREGQIALRQIKFWIHYHRAKLIQENVSKGILNSTNLYQRIESSSYRALDVSNYSSTEINAYGISFKKKQDRGSWRNTGSFNETIPKIVATPNDSS